MVAEKDRARTHLGMVGSTLNTYLKSSTIHGLTYLAWDRRQSCGQFAFWLLVMSGALGVAVLLISRSFVETREFPIITAIDSISIRHVPFPAVTIDAGNVINPWGYVEKVLNVVDFECYDTPFDCPSEKESVRADLEFLIEAVAKMFFEVAYEELRTKDLHYLKTEREKNVRMAQDFVFPEFKKAAATLALLFEKKSSRVEPVLKKLAKATSASFAKFTPTRFKDSKGWGSKYFYPIVAEEAGYVGITEEDVATCQDDLATCNATYNEAYAMMLLPFYFNRVPYQGLKLGELVSYFTRRVLSTNGKPDYSMFLTKIMKNLHYGDLAMVAFLAGMTGNLLHPNSLNFTTYEITKVLDKPYFPPGTGTEGQANFVGGMAGCVTEGQRPIYEYAWLSYIDQKESYDFGSRDYAKVMRQAPCTNETLDQEIGISGCCSVARPLRQELDMVLNVMKYSMQAPHFLQDPEEREKDYANLSSVVKYPIKDLSKGGTTEFWNLNPRIYLSQYDNQPEDVSVAPTSNLFARSYTNEGFGYTFNGRHFWNKHLSTNLYNRKFYHLMHPVPGGRAELPDVTYPRTSGTLRGLSLVLQPSKYEKAFRSATKRIQHPSKFRITLHDPDQPADLRSEAVDIRPGYSSTFLVLPRQVVTSESVGGLDLEKRRCKFHWEVEGLRIFSIYSRSACTFECSLALAEEKCRCVPWNYPQLNGTSDICDYMGAYCFEKVSLLLYLLSKKHFFDQCPIPPYRRCPTCLL